MFKSNLYIFRKTIRYPRITIKPTDEGADIIVSVPSHFTQEQAQNFNANHQQWIDKTLHKLQQQHSSLNDILDSHHNEILFFGEWISIESLRQAAFNEKQKDIFSYLKNQLFNYILEHLPHFATQMNVSYKSVKITQTASRFGSCTRDNRLFFALMLIFSPKDLINYVIIHELAHIVHKNHSSNFWNLVASHCPDWKKRRKILREEAKIFPHIMKRIKHIADSNVAFNDRILRDSKQSLFDF